MSLIMYKPNAPLDRYVHMFWAWDGYHMPHSQERILPSGMLEITIDLNNNPFHLVDHHAQRKTIKGPMIMGAQSHYFLIDTSQELSLLSVLFKPGGARPFFGVVGNEIHNVHLSLDILWGQSAKDLYEQLLTLVTPQQRFLLLEQILLKRLTNSDQRHRAVDYALKMFGQVPHQHTIRAVTEQLALSPTRFIQVFREDIGMTPKLYCRLQRFRYALSILAYQDSPNWVDVALSSGYYDQAHLINDFQAFAGMSPSRYAPQSPTHNTNLPELS